jgi:exoribonuclease R
VVRIDYWSTASQYPDGHYVRTIGEIGSLETEIESILIEHSIAVAPFSSNVLTHLPATPEDWLIPQEETSKRKDLRSKASHIFQC